jgi:hypothetical protein
MKRIIAALMLTALTAAVATPALAGGFRQGGAITPSPAFAYDRTAKGKSYRAPEYAPGFTAMARYNGMSHHGRHMNRQVEPQNHTSNG